MRTGTDTRPDWRDGAAYRALLGIDRAGLAWEWLRRDPEYIAYGRAAAADPGSTDGPALLRADARALDWGLHFRRTARAPRP